MATDPAFVTIRHLLQLELMMLSYQDRVFRMEKTLIKDPMIFLRHNHLRQINLQNLEEVKKEW